MSEKEFIFASEPEQTFNFATLAELKNRFPEFSPEQLKEIERKRRILSSLAYFIGKDFKMPVELNNTGAGWHWDFEHNIVRVDPKDLLEKPMDYLRFVISHEGGHRRISRMDVIPLGTWREPGFSFMTNAIEDPRDNNFVAENYPRFREQMQISYQMNFNFEAKAKEKAQERLGYQPRFMRAGFEYIKQWFRWQKGEAMELSVDLPDEIREVVEKTLAAATDSWRTYPSRAEADESEELISRYSAASYHINLEQIWPLFRTLIEKDLEDQSMQELLDEMQGDQAESGGAGDLPQELKDKLTEEQQKELEDAIEKAIEDAKQKQESKGDSEQEEGETTGEADESIPGQISEEEESGQPIDLDGLSPELKQKIKDYLDSLPKEQKQDLEEKAKKALADFEKDLDSEIGGKMSDNPEKKSEREQEERTTQRESESRTETIISDEDRQAQAERRQRMEALFESESRDPYHQSLEKVSDLIDMLTADLRDVFVRRKTDKYETGYRSGRRWNIRQIIREKVAGIPLFQTQAREQKESESEEMDYAITLLIDSSGSMRGEKIRETFKSAVVLGETLNNLGIKFEIVGFQDILLEFKSFSDQLDEPMRKKLSQMVLEVSGSNPRGHNNPSDNDDGVCLLQASAHLADQMAKNKFLIVLSDGLPETSGKSREQLDGELRGAIAEIISNTNQKLIGLGLNSAAVASYYENNISGITTEEMVETLGGLLREIIERY